jgi:hypothetical protein
MKSKKTSVGDNSKIRTIAQKAKEKQARDENILRAWDNGYGLSQRTICMIFHHSPHTVQKVIRNAKVGKRKKK